MTAAAAIGAARLSGLLDAHPDLPGEVASVLAALRDGMAAAEAEAARKAELRERLAAARARLSGRQAAAVELDRRYYAVVEANGWRGGQPADFFLRTDGDRHLKEERDRVKGEVRVLEDEARSLARRLG